MDTELPDQRGPNCERLEREAAQLKARIAKLEALFEQVMRRCCGGKRPAAHFGKETPK